MSEQPNAIDLEAALWVGLIERAPLPAEQQRQFELWMAMDAKHRGAFHRLRAASLHFDRLGALAGGRAVFAPARVNVSRRGIIAAALSVASLLGLGVWIGPGWIADAGRVRYATSIGQTRRVELPDGSEMILNTSTEVFVSYTRSRRELHLTRGEVLFTVARDVARPFVVRAGEWLVRALGTAFTVHGGDVDVVHVTVTAGTVELVPASSDLTPQRLPANHEATIGASGVPDIKPISHEEMQRRLAWRTGLIVFNGQPLHEVIVELNRYNHRKLRVEDPELSERHIVGVFRVTDTDNFVSILQATLGVQPLPIGDVTLLRPAASSP